LHQELDTYFHAFPMGATKEQGLVMVSWQFEAAQRSPSIFRPISMLIDKIILDGALPKQNIGV